MRLSRQERETIINLNEAEDIASVYTCSKSWMRYMESLGLEPTETHGSYAREYECPKAWIKKPRKPRRLSEGQKRKLGQRLSQKSILSQDLTCAVEESEGENDEQ